MAGAVVVVVALVAAGVALAGSGSDDSSSAQQGLPTRVGYTPKFETVTCPSDVHAAAAEATCGHLVVPQDRSKPAGKQVSLLVTRAPPRVANGNLPPSIDLCGCENVGNSITRDHAELIQLSARGFGGSDPMLACPEMSAERTQSLTKPANDPDEIARGASTLAQCHDRLVRDGIDPAQYNYKVAAQDALDLMIALHIGRADFTASELVSAELFEVVRRAPAVVRSITIDNPASPGQTELSDPIGDLSEAFGRFVARCHADPICAAVIPIWSRSGRRPTTRTRRRRRSSRASDPDDSSAPPVPILLDGPRAADALAAALTDAGTYRLIPAAITSPNSNAIVGGQVIRSDFATFHPDTAAWGALASYLSAYDVHTIDQNAATLEADTLPQFTRAQTKPWAQWCQAWKVPDVSGALSAEVASPVPALLFRGDLTPFGSDDWLRRVRRGLSPATSR